MKTRFLAVLGITLLGMRVAVAQWWGAGTQSIPGGITGQSIVRINYFDSQFGEYYETSQYPTSIDIRTANGRYVTTIRTDAQGRFRVILQPGKYILKPRTTAAHPSCVTVQSARFHSVVVRSQRYVHSSSGSDTVMVGTLPPIWPQDAVTLCHGGLTIQVSRSTLIAHLGHGDTIGPCHQ